MKDLHNAIMALPCTPGMLHESMHRAYEFGHRDARHAAAELAISAPGQKPFLYQNPMHPEQVSFRRVPNWRELFTRPQPVIKDAAELTDDDIDAIGVEFRGDYRVLRQFARAVLAAQKAKS